MFKRVLALSPHPDDVELGAGGLLARLAAQCDIAVIVFADCEPVATLRKECIAALQCLGDLRPTFCQLPNKELGLHRQQILDSLMEIGADLVLVPARWDSHQDHQVVTREAIRAFKHCSILGYDLPWNAFDRGERTVYVPLSGEQVAQKKEAVSKYVSQKSRRYMSWGSIKANLQIRGLQCGEDYAEAFECIRMKL